LTSDRATVGWALLLVLACVATFANGLDGELVYDDRRAILDVRYIQQLWPPWVPLWAEAELPVAGRPLASLSLALNHAWGGTEVRGYHVVNLAIHVGCALLLFAVVRETLRRPVLGERFGADATAIAGASALLWAVHPLQTECVSYVVARTESLMAFFYLATLYAAIRADVAPEPAARRLRGAAVAACFAGMLCKEAMVTAPFVVVAWDWAFRSEDFGRVAARRRGLWAGLFASWGALALLLASAPRGASVGFDLGVSPLQYLANQAELIVEYAQRVLWPEPLLIHYGSARDLPLAEVAPEALGLALAFAASAWALWRRSALGFLGVAFFALLSPTSSFVPIVTEVGSERRMYLPLATWTVAAATLGHLALARLPGPASRRWRSGVAAVLLAVVALALAARSRDRNEDYRTREALWRAQIEDAPEIPEGWCALGRVLDQRGELAAAADHYVRALWIDPDSLEARVNLGALRWRQGQHYEARRQFEEALRRHGEEPFVLANLGLLAREEGDLERASRHFERAIEIDPEEPVALLGLAEILTDHPDAARRDPERAVELAERSCHATSFADLRALEGWSAALAAAGQAPEALRVAEFAWGLARQTDSRVDRFRALLERRRAEASRAASGP